MGAPALSNNREREQLFARWLDAVKDDVSELYLLGDVFDFWFEYRKVVPRGFTRILGRLADLTDNGVKVHFFTGNHDLWVFDYLSEETGVIIHTHEYVVEIDGKTFYLAHGDGLDPDDKGYLFLKKIFTSKTTQWLFARLHPNFAFYLAHRWSKNSRLSNIASEQEFKVKNEGIYRFAESVLQQRKIEYFIFGHRHKMANVEMNENTRFILLGDWINFYSYGVFDGKEFELKQFEKAFKPLQK